MVVELEYEMRVGVSNLMRPRGPSTASPFRGTTLGNRWIDLVVRPWHKLVTALLQVLFDSLLGRQDGLSRIAAAHEGDRMLPCRQMRATEGFINQSFYCKDWPWREAQMGFVRRAAVVSDCFGIHDRWKVPKDRERHLSRSALYRSPKTNGSRTRLGQSAIVGHHSGETVYS